MINKVYFINLNHRLDRREHIEQLLKDSDLFDITERVSALYNKALPPAGCILSHIVALERFIGSKAEYCLILEDDFTTNNIDTLKENIQKLFDDGVDFDIVQISGNHLNLESGGEYPSYLKKVFDSQTTSGYIINRRFTNTLLENFKESYTLISEFGRRHEYCLDIFWKKLQPISKWYCFFPPLGYQMDGYSDIEKRNVSYKC